MFAYADYAINNSGTAITPTIVQTAMADSGGIISK
jgi:hypothetical protein